MDKFPNTYNFPKLNQEESDNLNRMITTTEIEAVIKKLPTNRRPGPWNLPDIQRRINTYPSQTIPKNSKREKVPKLILRSQHYPNSKNKQRHYKEKKNDRSMTLVNIDANILNKILANQIQ